MPCRTIRCLALLIALAVIPLRVAAVEWESDVDAALARAHAEHKLVILEIRHPDCASCNDQMEAVADPIWSDPAVAPNLEQFIFVRILDPVARGLTPSGLVRAITDESRSPSITLADASGTAILTVKPKSPQVTRETFAAMTLADPAIRDVAVAAAEARLAGNLEDAEAGLGRVRMYLREWKRATATFESAAKKYRASGKRDLAQRMELHAAFCWYRIGQEGSGRNGAAPKAAGHAIAANVAAHPATPAIGAEAWHLRGLLYLADASAPRTLGFGARSVEATTTGKEMRLALQAFRKAYAMAPAGSDVLLAARAQLESLDTEPLPRRAEVQAMSAFRILVPARRPLTGEIDVSVESDIDLTRVEYYVDDLRVATSDRKPFTAKVDLGNIPMIRALKAVALDADGNAVGEAVQTINDRADAMHVAITAPVKDAVPATTGVEAAVDVPAGRSIRSVDFFFNDEKFGSLTAPPFRHALAVNGRFGYIRVVAMLDDGSTGEDTRLVNTGGQSESVNVQGVTFIATVLDKKGRRIDGLKPSDFVVSEDANRVDASAVNGAVEDPVTVGFAIDSSDSMSFSLLFAKDLSTQVVTSALRANDRAFLVSFDTTPRMAHAASGDAASIRNAIDGLTAVGGTSIFDGILFALQQFQSIPGKKALMVISDGGEGHSSSNARTCVRLAKALGIPVYGVSPPGSSRVFNPLPNLARLTGGLFIYAPPRVEFPALAARIRDEVRGQYLITFVSKLPSKPGAWRTLRVTVPAHPDAVVRTIRGYYVK